MCVYIYIYIYTYYTHTSLSLYVFSDPAPGKYYATTYEQMGS